MAQDRFMALDALALMRHSNASWKLLASDDAAFCCAFFYQEFLYFLCGRNFLENK